MIINTIMDEYMYTTESVKVLDSINELKALLSVEDFSPEALDIEYGGKTYSLDTSRGICAFSQNLYFLIAYNNLNGWDKYTGDAGYPVQHPTLPSDKGFYAEDNLWVGEYGKNRLELVAFLLKYLENDNV